MLVIIYMLISMKKTPAFHWLCNLLFVMNFPLYARLMQPKAAMRHCVYWNEKAFAACVWMVNVGNRSHIYIYIRKGFHLTPSSSMLFCSFRLLYQMCILLMQENSPQIFISLPFELQSVNFIECWNTWKNKQNIWY